MPSRFTVWYPETCILLKPYTWVSSEGTGISVAVMCKGDRHGNEGGGLWMAGGGTLGGSGTGFPGLCRVSDPWSWAGTHRVEMNELYLTLDCALVELPSAILGFVSLVQGF